MDNQEKVYFTPGSIVTLKHNIPNTPVMYVVEKVNQYIKDNKGNVDTLFKGIRCRWFDKNGQLQEAIFCTKDLIFYNK